MYISSHWIRLGRVGTLVALCQAVPVIACRMDGCVVPYLVGLGLAAVGIAAFSEFCSLLIFSGLLHAGYRRLIFLFSSRHRLSTSTANTTAGEVNLPFP